jgi:signal transduction histidine kinase
VLVLVGVTTLIINTVNIRSAIERRRAVIDLTDRILELDTRAVSLALDFSPGRIDETKAASAEIDAAIQEFVELSPSLPGGIQVPSEQVEVIRRSNQAMKEAIELLEARMAAGSEETERPELEAFDQLLTYSEEMLKATEEIEERLIQRLLNVETVETVISISIMVVIVLFLIGIGTYVIRVLVRPLTGLEKSTHAIAKGEFDVELDLDRSDEIGDLGRSFNTMALELSRAFSDLEDEIAERVQAERALQETNTELAGFAHTVSHDIKGPISTLGVAACMLEEDLGDLPDGQRRSDMEMLTGSIKASVEKVMRLIDDLLALAESGSMPADASDVVVVDVVRDILLEESLDIETRGVRIDLDPDLGRVKASRAHVYQVFSNLIRNALKHGASAAPVIGVSYGGLTPDGHLYRIRDNGPGIPEDQMKSIFAPFSKGVGGGTGIGLAIVDRIVSSYGGRVRAFNEGGAVFEFMINDLETCPASVE